MHSVLLKHTHTHTHTVVKDSNDPSSSDISEQFDGFSLRSYQTKSTFGPINIIKLSFRGCYTCTKIEQKKKKRERERKHKKCTSNAKDSSLSIAVAFGLHSSRSVSMSVCGTELDSDRGSIGAGSFALFFILDKISCCLLKSSI